MFSRFLLLGLLGAGMPLANNIAHATSYWVATNGNDSNNCIAENTACRTIGQALSLATQAGDIINIKSGTYQATQPGCTYFTIPTIGCLQGSGTAAKPIVIQAAPGHESGVTLDGQGSYAGIHLKGHDFVHIRHLQIINMHTVGITNGGPNVRAVANDDDFSVGVSVTNNRISNIRSVNSGSNPGGIRMDNSKSWVVRDNSIHTVCGLEHEGGCRYINAGCIYSYRVWDATVEHNECNNSGSMVKWKDHVLDADSLPTLPGSIVRYNLGYDLAYGFHVSHGDQDPQSSNHTVSNNIFYHIDSACMVLFTETLSDTQSVNYRFEHNICDKADVGILSTHAQLASSRGNIFSNITGYPSTAISDIYRFSNNNQARLDSSDYNIFSPDFPRSLMSNPTGDFIYNTLTQWQNPSSVNGGNLPQSLNTQPDPNSFIAQANALFIDADNHNYLPADNAPSSNAMPDSSNIGAYRFGNEIIGIRNQVPPQDNSGDLLDFLPAIINATEQTNANKRTDQ